MSLPILPHKRNPQLALDLLSMSAQLRALAAPALESMQHDHEANGGMTDLLEETVARATVLAGDILTRLDVILDGLELDEQRMRANLALSEGLIGSESLMMELGERIGRQKAHEVIYEVAQESAVGDEQFLDLLVRNATVSAYFDRAEICRLIDPRAYLGESVTIAHEMAQHARAVADRLEFSARTAEPVPLFARGTAAEDDADDAEPVIARRVDADRVAPVARSAEELMLVGL
jgi:3-carboxy-cis,cis-muconate cycloisomerase